LLKRAQLAMDCAFSPSSKSKKAPAQNDPPDDDDFQTPADKKARIDVQTPAAKKPAAKKPAAKKPAAKKASDSEFCDRDEDDSETDASSSQVRLRLSGSDVHRTLPIWATSYSFVCRSGAR
jgi:hypothetical protein